MELLEELRNAKLKKPPANGKVAFLRNIDQIKGLFVVGCGIRPLSWARI